MNICPLSSIHNTSLISAYIGLDKRQCECLEYCTFTANIMYELQNTLYLHNVLNIGCYSNRYEFLSKITA
jgi:hypothetical protein